ncbi:uncharacterized protein LOC107639169 isoform X3 [Arachis ipaensis]|uniref:uncharacterized protein LOC107639169 isoform X3 n=1 Tax=Arachis ipaensis TaxID=130454 RepID=UPI000A2B8C5E|nr:uncharacterized protein LOC107639169 isoform X3 [Arachis ipaensis]XP_025646860.1 uncharacterized protein LOC112741900 isoform X3 [Arachis hypogaea]
MPPRLFALLPPCRYSAAPTPVVAPSHSRRHPSVPCFKSKHVVSISVSGMSIIEEDMQTLDDSRSIYVFLSSSLKSNVYSFGVILWEPAAEKIPWDNLNSMQVLMPIPKPTGYAGDDPYKIWQWLSSLQACCVVFPPQNDGGRCYHNTQVLCSHAHELQ